MHRMVDMELLDRAIGSVRLDPHALTNNTDLISQMRQQQRDGNMTAELQVIPARRGRAVRLAKGQTIQIINTHGQQVVDT